MTAEPSSEAKEQASLFLTLVIQGKPVWGLRNEGGGLATWKFDDSDETLIPFWTDRDKAELCARAHFEDYLAFEMEADYFTGSVLPQLEQQGILVGVNLSDRMGGMDLPASDLLAEIRGARS